MRRLVFPVIVASGLVMIGAGSASAEPAATVAAEAKAVPGKKMCKIVDPKLDEVSGLVATKSGYIAINDSTDLTSHKRVFFLDQDCAITKSVPFSGGGPRDTEDMVLSPDGNTLWIADAGDNSKNRATVSVWTMPVTGAAEPVIHRLSYPNGEKYDSEALLLSGNEIPILVTKEAGKPASFYQPASALQKNNTAGVPMKKVGEFQPPETDTASGQFPRLLRRTVTGAAISPDGTKVALRTYTDAYEWDVANGDVLTALKATPRKTPLENEPFGEAISYSSDGKYFYTVSDMQGAVETTGENLNYILRYTPAAKVVTASTGGATGADGKAAGSAWYKNLTIDDITYIVGGVGVLGAILVACGVVGIVRFRKKPFTDPEEAKVVDGGPAGAGPRPIDAATELLAVGGQPPGTRNGVYGRPGAAAAPTSGRPGGPPVPAGGRPGQAPGGARPGPVYGAKPAQPPSTPQRGGGVYGGGGGGGGGQQGGRPPQGGQQPSGRPPQGGQQGGGQRPGRPGVYGGPPQPPSAQGGQPSQRPSGFFGQNNRTDMNGYNADPSRNYDNRY